MWIVYVHLCIFIYPSVVILILNLYWNSFFISSAFLLSQALQERDDQIRRQREEAVQGQKRLQQQQEEETARQTELRERLEHLSLRKEELKQQLEDKEAELEDVKRVYRQA